MPEIRVNNDRICGTCEYWGGEREIKRNNPHMLICENGSHPCGVRQLKIYCNNGVCQKYRKWNYLP